MSDGFGIDLRDKQAYAWMAKLPDKIRTALEAKISQVGDLVKAKVASELSGGLLNARSGDLRDSVSARVEATPTSVATVISSSSPYAGALEYGVHKNEMVPASKREITAIFGSAKESILAEVRPHDRLMKIKGRHFMGLAAQEVQAQFVAEMTSAVAQALAG